jgi:hypothetical protein
MIGRAAQLHILFLANGLPRVVNNLRDVASVGARRGFAESFTRREGLFARNLLTRSESRSTMKARRARSKAARRLLMKSTTLAIAGVILLAHLPALRAENIFVFAAFDRSPDTAALQWMQQETARVYSGAGVVFSWRLEDQHDITPAGALRVKLQVHGDCRIEPNAVGSAEDGPMGWIESLDGEIRPFIDVDCDRISAMVWQNRGTLPAPLMIRVFGRALGRVLAHELYHYVTQSAAHSASGIFRRALTSTDLMLPEVRLGAAEMEAIRKAIRAREGAMPTAARPATE